MARKNGAPPPIFRDIVEDADYQQNLAKRARLGILPAAVETKVWEYAYGKPAEEINLNLTNSYAEKSTEELVAIAAALQEELRSLRESDSVH